MQNEHCHKQYVSVNYKVASESIYKFPFIRKLFRILQYLGHDFKIFSRNDAFSVGGQQIKLIDTTLNEFLLQNYFRFNLISMTEYRVKLEYQVFLFHFFQYLEQI